ncbi:hypothetical protein [Fontivita pretiosa]|uniref:hypothetical protein n=1 Tax=Fontivita pretiosa TaxID=2989684 RepID=UPI003D17E1C4
MTSTVGVCCAGILIFFIWNQAPWNEKDAFSSCFKLITIAIVGTGCGSISAVMLFVLARALKDQRKGPYLVYSILSGTVRLPREKMVFRKAEVLGWRVVTGNWVGPDGHQTKWRDAISELQLIVQTGDGPMAYAVVGWCRIALTETVHELAQATGFPLEIVEQRQGVERVASQKFGEWD